MICFVKIAWSTITAVLARLGDFLSYHLWQTENKICLKLESVVSNATGQGGHAGGSGCRGFTGIMWTSPSGLWYSSNNLFALVWSCLVLHSGSLSFSFPPILSFLTCEERLTPPAHKAPLAPSPLWVCTLKKWEINYLNIPYLTLQCCDRIRIGVCFILKQSNCIRKWIWTWFHRFHRFHRSWNIENKISSS